MTISLTPTRSEVLGVDPPSSGTHAFFSQELRALIHEAILAEFIRQERGKQMSRTKLAERSLKAKEQITRWLGAPSNLTLDTISNLLLAMGMKVAAIRLAPFDEERQATTLRAVPRNTITTVGAGTIGVRTESPDKRVA